MKTPRSHTPRSNVSRALLLLAGFFFLACAALYNEWTIRLAVGAVHAVLHRPWTHVPDALDVRRMELVYAALGAVSIGAAHLAGSRPSLDRFFRRPIVAKLVLAFLAFGVPFTTLEVALRPYTDSDQKTTSLFVKDRSLGWRMRASTTQPWGGVTVSTNAKGLRGPEVPYERTAGRARILYLGDSVTIGYMVERWQDTFPFVADSLLAASLGVPVETVNAGVDGYSPWQEHLYLRDEGLEYDPDLVVVNFVLNDVTEQFTLVRYGGFEESRQLRESYYSRLDMILAHSALAYQVKNFAREWKGKRALGANPQLAAIKQEMFDVDTIMRRPEKAHVQAAWKITLESLQAIFDLCGARGVPVVVVIHPFRVQLDAPDELSAPQRQLAVFARERGVSVVDMLPILHRYLDDTNQFPQALFLDHDHYSVEGHRAVAGALADSLRAAAFGRVAR